MKNLFRSLLVMSVLFLFSNESQAQYRTGEFVNNQELAHNQLVQLQEFTGNLFKGHYYLDQYGFFGVVGYQPAFNLKDMIQYKRALIDGNFPPQFNDPNPFLREAKFLAAQSTLTLQVSEQQFGKANYSPSSKSNAYSQSGDYYERTGSYTRGREGNTSFYQGNSFRGNNTSVTTDGETTILMNRSGKIIRPPY